MIRVSVIIPVYNVSSYLRRCLDSVLAQSLKEIEVICVDDASTDDSPKILQEYAAKDARVKVVRQKNAGAGAARNTGLDLAQGEYLSFLDSDDFFEPDMLEKAYALAKRDMDDIVVFGSDQFRQKDNAGDGSDDGTFVSVDWTIRRNNLPSSQPFSYRELTGNVFKTFVGWAWDKLFRHQFITEHNIRYQVQRTTNDMLFVYTALVLAERISILDEVMVHQRRDSRDSLSKTRENSWHCFHDALIELKNRLIQEGIYAKLTKDYVNYSLHFTLWNYNSLAEPTKSMLREKLLSEWFDEFGISGRDRYYFENQKEYDQYLDMLYGTEETGSGAGNGSG
ncbi:MAG: glycosyltransferase family 2 protein, partial [Lachnospiraceae bacterium]|nr:glycosyltransferase family 2 protein [Lachnospiraceae bacterium]